MRAKITAYNNTSSSPNCSNFSLNTYWGSGYKNIYYLCCEVGRSTFVDTIETVLNGEGQEIRQENNSVERYSLSTIVATPFLATLKVLDKHDVITLENLDTGDVWNIRNINIEDDGENLDVEQRVILTYEIGIINSSSDNGYTIEGGSLAFWDNDNSGSIDYDGEAFYNAGGFFRSWQLYFEQDLLTPVSSGNVQLLMYVETNGASNLVGEFNGVFGDSFSDSSKWLSTQNVWDYFNLSDTVGHTNEVEFAKFQFASDNGYLSDELEDRSVEVKFQLSIDNSPYQETTLSKVYSSFGAFNSIGVQQVSGEYGITTINKVDEKMTVQNQNDVRQPLPTGSSTLITSFVQVSSNSWTNKYEIDIAPSGEHGYTNSFITNGGYSSESYRAANGSDNYTIGLNEINVIGQTGNILNFTTGNSPYLLNLGWKFDKQGTHSNIGNVVDGTAGIYLDGVLAVSLGTINSGSTFVTGADGITLPTTGVHEIEFRVDTTNAVLFNRFQCQIKPLF